MLTMMMLTIMMILVIIITMIATISKKSIMDREKMTPFECGFDPKCPARMPFSLQFFLIAIIFLIFDIEIALLLPFTWIMSSSHLITLSITLLVFITILLVGLYHEWNQGALDWAK